MIKFRKTIVVTLTIISQMKKKRAFSSGVSQVEASKSKSDKLYRSTLIKYPTSLGII